MAIKKAISDFFNLHRLVNFFQSLKYFGGIRNTMYQYYRNDNMKTGTLMGIDNHGNKYYQNNHHFLGSNRWCDYSPTVGMLYDASQIPAEWHRWMHYMTDKLPHEDNIARHHWIAEFKPNLTGEKDQIYIPYTTTRPKVEYWMPKNKKN